MSVARKCYIVKSGDSLSKIALREYSDAAKWKMIYDANRKLLPDPNKLQSGQVLTIPEDELPAGGKKQRSQMSVQEQLDNPEKGVVYPVELEVLELLIGLAALLRGLAKQGIKVLAKRSTKLKKNEVFKEVANPKTGAKHYPNSPYQDKSVHPKEMMEKINKQIEKETKEALGSGKVADQNAEIKRIHDHFVESGEWPLKRKDLGEYHMSSPDADLMKARQDYLKELQTHKP